MRAEYEKLIHINSAFKTGLSDDNGSFTVSLNNASYLQDAIYVRVKSVSVANMFDNVYGNARHLFLDQGSGVVQLTIAAGRYDSTTLAAAIEAATVASPLTATVTTTVVADYFNFACATPTQFLGMSTLKGTYGLQQSMNSIVGFGHADTTFSVNQTAPYLPALFGPTKVFFSSDQIAFGNSVHSNGHIHSKFASLSLSTTSYGAIAYNEMSDSANNTIWFRDTTNMNAIDVELVDEFDQVLSLPPNAHVDIEIISGHHGGI
jgi:hypothetical protein